MTLLVQDRLRAGATLEDLTREFHLLIKRSVERQNLVLLKYHQIESPMTEPLVQQCRGLILDEANNWEVVARPFDKFFNLGEPHAAPVDWNTARCLEKLDGSLMQLYWYDGQWHVASSGTPDASGNVNGSDETFADLFWRVWREKGYRLPDDIGGIEARDQVFLFELMTPLNRVVVRHDSNRLVLIGVRDRSGQEEHPFLWVDAYDVVQNLDSSATPESLAKSFESIDPLKQEGYVVVDDDFRRVKVKHPGYVALHQLRDGMSPRRILEVVRGNESSEVLTYFPEWTEAFASVREVFDGLVAELEQAYTRIKDEPVQKAFAAEALKTRHSGALFSVRNGKSASIRQHLATVPIRGLADLLRLEEVEL